MVNRVIYDLFTYDAYSALTGVVAVKNSLEKCFAARINCRRPYNVGTFHSDYMQVVSKCYFVSD